LNNKFMRIVFLLSFFTLISFSAFSQKNKTEGHIKWRDEYKLTWNDFQAKPRKSHFASALSDITFSVSIKSEGNKLVVFIEPSFNPKGSWVKKDDKSEYLLKHEQLHFDIYEVNARKFRKELQSKNLTSANAQSIVNKLIKKYSALNVKIQERYDKETDHSIKTEKQESWNKKIAAELEELKEYSESQFSVSIEMR